MWRRWRTQLELILFVSCVSAVAASCGQGDEASSIADRVVGESSGGGTSSTECRTEVVEDEYGLDVEIEVCDPSNDRDTIEVDGELLGTRESTALAHWYAEVLLTPCSPEANLGRPPTLVGFESSIATSVEALNAVTQACNDPETFVSAHATLRSSAIDLAASLLGDDYRPG